MVPIWYAMALQPAHSDTVMGRDEFEGSCQKPPPLVRRGATWRRGWRGGYWLAADAGARRGVGGLAAFERSLLDDSGHRLQPPGRAAARPYRSVVERGGDPRGMS